LNLIFLQINREGDKGALVPGGYPHQDTSNNYRRTQGEWFQSSCRLHSWRSADCALILGLCQRNETQKDFMDLVESPHLSLKEATSGLKTRVEAFTTQFLMPGV